MKSASFLFVTAFIVSIAVAVHAAAPAEPAAASAPGAGRSDTGTPGRLGGVFGGGARGGPGGGQAAVAPPPGTPGYPDGKSIDPAVWRKDKWPPMTPTFQTPAGFTSRAPGDNGFYLNDANGNHMPGTDFYHFAPTGHFTNYDRNDVPPYTLPDQLAMQDGRKVTSAEMWRNQRRQELVNLFKDNIYGRVPEDKLPKIIWEVRQNEKSADGKTITKQIVGYFEGTTPDAVPAGRAGGGFGGGFGFGGRGGNTIVISLTLPNAGRPAPLFSGGPVNDPLGRGWGTFSVSGNAGLVARIAPPQGQPRPDNFPGNYAVTAWAFSRAIDYLDTDKDVDSKHITIAGMSTGGKQVLYTAAMEERIWCVIPQSSGAMGLKLSRRDIGETVDDLATGQFAGNYCPNFAKYVGKWNDMPVDQHELVALIAPRKMFVTGGNKETWQDVEGCFLACVAAEPVYNLLGKKGLNAMELPPVEKPIVFGEIGFYQHEGGHTVTAQERTWITAWMEKLLNSDKAAR